MLPEGWRVFRAVLDGEPNMRKVVERAVREGVDELVVIPMYAQYSSATSGVIVGQLYGILADVVPSISVVVRPAWHDDAGYVSALAALLAAVASAHALDPREAHLLFVADGEGTGTGELDDPYLRYVRRTVELVVGRLGWATARASVSFASVRGSGGGPEPGIGGELARLVEQGQRHVLACALAPAMDGEQRLRDGWSCYCDRFAAAGGQLYSCPPLSTHPSFLAALRNIVLRGPRPLIGRRKPVPMPSTVPARSAFDGDVKSLVVVGAMIPNRVGSGGGPSLRYSDPEAFVQVRKSRKELREFLDWTREQTYVQEAFVWNTCQRVEFWGWLADPDEETSRACVVAQIREQLYGREPPGLAVNVLFGADSWHHALRTASGLNSALPGDLDVVAQLQVSCRIAERAGTAGPRANRFVDDVIELSDEVRSETDWGQYGVGYCHAALARVHAGRLGLGEQRHVVIGGSATSRSILSTLAEQFHVPKRRVTLIYRDHHGQMRLLRAAIGNGRRLRVHSYAEDLVLQAIADADFVYFGIDHAEPVLGAAELVELRDYRSRPLTIVDFNSCGSLREEKLPEYVSMWREKDLDRAVAEFAKETYSGEQFARAIDDAERWLACHAPESSLQRLDLPCSSPDHHARSTCRTCWVLA